jgi:hypothetical protein
MSTRSHVRWKWIFFKLPWYSYPIENKRETSPQNRRQESEKLSFGPTKGPLASENRLSGKCRPKKGSKSLISNELCMGSAAPKSWKPRLK